jgi:hypothetical protein
MNNKRKVFIVLIFMLFIIGCKNQSNNLKIIGDWYCLLPDSSYSEVYINNDKVRVLTSKNGWFGPYEYKIKDDSLCFKSIENYKIGKKGCDEIVLRNNNSVFRLKRIELEKVKADTSFFNPFNLRRCNFLVHEGVITMRDAMDYLKSLKKASVKEEKIHIK